MTVTDDDSTVVDELNFVELIKPMTPSRSIELYAFVAIPNVTVPKISNPPAADDCAPARRDALFTYSRSYVKLAQKTGGMAYNICNKDWKPQFDGMAKKITETLQAETTYDLGLKGIAKIVSATINSKSISLDRLQLINGASLVVPSDLVVANAIIDLKLEMNP